MIALVPRDSLMGMIAGPIVWGLYFVLSYAVAGIACSLGYQGAHIGGMNAVRLLLLVAGVLAAVLIVIAGAQAYGGRRRAHRRREARADDDAERHDFLYTTALALCALSLVGTLWLVMAALASPVC